MIRSAGLFWLACASVGMAGCASTEVRHGSTAASHFAVQPPENAAQVAEARRESLPEPPDPFSPESDLAESSGDGPLPSDGTEPQPAAIVPVQFVPPAPDEDAVRAATPAAPAAEPPVYPLDLSSALAMTGGRNPQIAFAQARIRESLAQLQAAEVLWLPTIRAGANFNKHEGKIQDVQGNVFNTSRTGTYGGLGARGIGQGSPTFPGIIMQFDTADAIYEPRIATRVAQAREQSARATLNDQLLDTALAYLDLLEALQRRAIATETVRNAEDLADLTDAFARSGQGTQADADRMAAALAVQRNQLARAEEAVMVASARLSQQLSIDPTVPIDPQEPTVVPIHLAPTDAALQELVATALSNRPELAESQMLVAEALERLSREKNSPWLPSIFLGMDYGVMGGGLGNHIGNSGDRWDFDAVALWSVRNLGFGEQAARNQARSLIEQAQFRQVRVMDNIAREVVEAHAQVEARQRQIEVAQGAITAAENSYRRNLQRIREGQGLPIEVLQSLLALNEARLEYLRAVVDYNEAQFRLHRALGWAVCDPLP